ncbi:MAG: hypothetical protein ACYCXJ_10025 [Thermoleophilia bacterium]
MKSAKAIGYRHRGKFTKALLLGVIMLVGISFVAAGCGDEDTGNSGTQLDDSATTGQADDIKNIDSAGGVNLAGDDEVLAGYTWSSCVVEMTARYGDEKTAERVCGNLYTEHGSTDVAQLDTVLAQVESNLGVTPTGTGGTGGTGGGTGGTGGTGGGTGGSGGTGDTGGGWSTEIIVPPAP